MPFVYSSTFLLLLLAQYVAQSLSQVQTMPGANNFTVGNVSNVLIEIACNTPSMWLFGNGSKVSDPLVAFGVSQSSDGGDALRIYPGGLVSEPELSQFTCANNAVMVEFSIFESIFFINPLPTFLLTGASLNCLLPTIPSSIVSTATNIRNGVTLQYCNVSTDRGAFISGEVPVLVPVYTIHPANISVSVNGLAVFSCSIFPDINLLNITWFFDDEMGFTDIITDGVTDNFPHIGTSVLMISNVSDTNIGDYFCVSYFTSEQQPVTSQRGFLNVTGDPPLTPFALRPPVSLSVYEGSNLTIPCVAADGFNTIWSPLPLSNVLADSISYSIINANRNNSGNVVCQVNGTESTIQVNVSFLEFITVPDNETVVPEGANITLNCVADGNPSPGTIRWLRNATEISNGPVLELTNVQSSDSGIYQCVAGLDRPPYSSITALTYLIVEFIRDAVVDPLTQLTNPLDPVSIDVNCTILSQPLVMISWSTGGISNATQLQFPTGFRGPSVSQLTVVSSDLAGTHVFNCSGVIGGVQSIGSAIINAYSPVTILQNPNDSQPVLFGDTVTFSCVAMSVPLSSISWIRNGENLSNSTNVTITQSDEGQRRTSVLEVVVDGEEDFAEYYCMADNSGFFNATSTRASLLRGALSVITISPTTQPVVINDIATYNCTAAGLPLPSISWYINGADPPTGFTVNGSPNGPREFSSNLTGPITTNDTIITCNATNRFNTNITQVTQIIAGPPLSPQLFIPQPEARTANVTWTEPFSFIQITNYTVTLSISGSLLVTFTVDSTYVTFNDTHLDPFRNYSVSVTAHNRAGSSLPSTEIFTTAQAAPTGSPSITMTSSSMIGEIYIEWSLIPEPQRNGMITHYVIQYSNSTITLNETVNGGTTTNTRLRNLVGGVQYTLKILGATVIGEGPFSMARQQFTIENPAPIADIEPVVPDDHFVTTNSIPIRFPSQLTSSNTQFLWVVVIKLNDTIQAMLFPSNGSPVSPDDVYSTNSTFLNITEVRSGDIPFGRPYVASEITFTASVPSSVFYIGSSTTNTLRNDEPERYDNPPLEQGTRYTYFVRAFPPPASESTMKRQVSDSPRQYSVFSSSQFGSPQTTNSFQTLSPGVVAAIVIVIIILFLILVVLVVIAFILFFRPRYKYFPPAARSGSVRLTESQKLLGPGQGYYSRAKPSGQVSVVHGLKKTPDLAELTPTDQREPISVAHFAEYTRSLHANTDHLFSEEYEQLTIKSPSLSHQNSLLPCNQIKNRYANINSFDDTRVILTEIPGVEGSDYINANYIDGYGSRDTYIACQGPLADTTQDFWRMVWEQKSSCIVMLTNCVEKGRPKCHQYWPQTGSMTFGELSITIVDQQVLAYYTIRTFKLMVGNESREVKQFHYTAWPDFGVPDHPNPIISFIKRINNVHREGPDIVHCSAGVGRSGTYISVQSMMAMIEAEGRVDVFNFVLDMRHKRNYMVQTEAQYIFVHDTLVEFIKVGETEMTVQSFPKEIKTLLHKENESDICPLEEQFDKLNALDITVPSRFISATLPINKSKNRYPDILPYEAYRVRLLMLPGVNGSDYINASFVDGYLRCNQFIMTQGPLNNTVDDFWRMVWECRVSAIVMLCQLKENGKDQSAPYWPTDKLTQYGDMFIETLSENDTGFYVIREIQITHTKQGNEVRLVKQFHYLEWFEDKCPETSAALIDMIGLVQKAHHLFGGGPVIVHDSSSIGRAGTFCILNIVIERLKVEGMIDVFFSVHSLRRKHPGIIANYDQYKFCYNTVIEYLNSFDKYANFD